jgi:hypothetical protein
MWVEQSSTAIAAALEALAHDSALRASMGVRAVQFARARFSWNAIASAMAEQYVAVARKGASRRVPV